MSTSPDTTRSHVQHCAGTSRCGITRPIRAAVLALLLAAGCYLAYGVGKLCAEWRKVSQPFDVRQMTTAEFAPQAMVLPLAGQWSFAELDWKLRSHTIDKNDVAERFDSLVASAADQNGNLLPEVSPEIMQLVERLQLEPAEREGNRIYQLNRLGLRAQLITRIVAGRPKAVSLAAAYPQQDGQWQLLELMPFSASAESATPPQPFLLPLPAGAARVGGRFADDGRALLELITLSATADELFATWKAAGWEARAIRQGGANDFRYLCARGDDVIYVWSADEPGTIRNLMLVRTPNNDHSFGQEKQP